MKNDTQNQEEIWSIETGLEITDMIKLAEENINTVL